MNVEVIIVDTDDQVYDVTAATDVSGLTARPLCSVTEDEHGPHTHWAALAIQSRYGDVRWYCSRHYVQFKSEHKRQGWKWYHLQ
jgi:hypothetical protein